MGWFGGTKKADANSVDISQCNPIIVNHTNQSVVLFLDRGVLYNKQVLKPGEAVGMTRKETAGTVVPYKIHAVVGDEQALPTRRQSIKNALSTAVIPTAFIVGTFMAASSAGTLTGPASALGRITGGMVVKGMVIDSAALAAGSLTASRAAMIADRLIEKHPQNFSAKSGLLMPGNRFVIIQGGIEEPLTFSFVKEKQFRQIPIEQEIKVPFDTLMDKVGYYTPSIFKSTKDKEGADVEALAAEVVEAEEQETTTTEQLEASAPPAIEDTTTAQSTATLEEETEEDRQLRQAIEESLQMEEQRKQQQQEQSKDDEQTPVVLF